MQHKFTEPEARCQRQVRDIYDLGDKLLLVATDRISAFDWVNPSAFLIRDASSPDIALVV